MRGHLPAIFNAEIEKFSKQFINKYNPQKLILFGSHAKGTARYESDMDICVVMETPDKRAALTDMYVSIESDKPFDIVIYTPDEWNDCVNDKTSFAYQINQEGAHLHG